MRLSTSDVRGDMMLPGNRMQYFSYFSEAPVIHRAGMAGGL